MLKTLKEIWSSLKTKEQRYLKAGLWLIVSLGFFSIIVLPYLLTRESISVLDYKSSGGIGDTINGIAGPFIAIMASILTFLAFYIQYKANIQQRQQFIQSLKDQRRERITQDNIWRIERFENKYFELIKLHRGNILEIGISTDVGKKVFVLMIREFREILKIAISVSKSMNINFTNEEYFIISFQALFFGVGPNSSRLFKNSVEEYDKSFIYEFEKTLNNSKKKEEIKMNRGFKYTPFEGHISRLSHYYRHLYQTVCFVKKQTIEIDKKEYINILRAQLSTHEQALLFINSLTPTGKVWRTEGILEEYKFVKNIPKVFFDVNSEIDISEYFSSNYFDY